MLPACINFYHVCAAYRQCSDTNKKVRKVNVLPIRIIKSNVSSVGSSLRFSLPKGQRSKRETLLSVSAL